MLQVSKQKNLTAQIQLTYEIFENLLWERVKEEKSDSGKEAQETLSSLTHDKALEGNSDSDDAIVGNPWDQITRRTSPKCHPRCKYQGILS